ncbi:uncharacterized protein [Amphiura filiformis]|uniref:uncharacterized protein n=1 Tax=Amphiura filiformis TaxID=82378 RepID=UPI003B2250A2
MKRMTTPTYWTTKGRSTSEEITPSVARTTHSTPDSSESGESDSRESGESGESGETEYEEIVFSFTLEEETFTEDLNDLTSPVSLLLSGQLTAGLQAVYQNEDTDVLPPDEIIIIDYTAGSIIPTVQLLYSSPLDESIKAGALGAVYNEIQNNGGFGGFEVSKLTAIGPDGSQNIVDECTILPCPLDMSCAVSVAEGIKLCKSLCVNNADYCYNNGECQDPAGNETLITCSCTAEFTGPRCNITQTPAPPHTTTTMSSHTTTRMSSQTLNQTTLQQTTRGQTTQEQTTQGQTTVAKGAQGISSSTLFIIIGMVCGALALIIICLSVGCCIFMSRVNKSRWRPEQRHQRPASFLPIQPKQKRGKNKNKNKKAHGTAGKTFSDLLQHSVVDDDRFNPDHRLTLPRGNVRHQHPSILNNNFFSNDGQGSSSTSQHHQSYELGSDRSDSRTKQSIPLEHMTQDHSRTSMRSSNPSLNSQQQRGLAAGHSFPFRLGPQFRSTSEDQPRIVQRARNFKPQHSMYLPKNAASESVRSSQPMTSQTTSKSQPQTVNWREHYDIGKLVEDFENKSKANGKPKKRRKEVTFDFPTLRNKFHKLYHRWQNGGVGDSLRTDDFNPPADIDEESSISLDDEDPRIFEGGAYGGTAIPAERAQAARPDEREEAAGPSGYQLPFDRVSNVQDYEPYLNRRQSKTTDGRASTDFSDNFHIPLVIGEKPAEGSSSSSGRSRGSVGFYQRWDFSNVGTGSDLYMASTAQTGDGIYYEPSPFIHPLQEESYF